MLTNPVPYADQSSPFYWSIQSYMLTYHTLVMPVPFTDHYSPIYWPIQWVNTVTSIGHVSHICWSIQYHMLANPVQFTDYYSTMLANMVPFNDQPSLISQPIQSLMMANTVPAADKYSHSWCHICWSIQYHILTNTVTSTNQSSKSWWCWPIQSHELTNTVTSIG